LHLDRVATMRQHCLQEELALLRRVGNLIRWACPHLAEKVETVVGTLDARLTEASRGPTHRDLKADHILLDGNRLALVDLDSFGEADPVLDAASLTAQLLTVPLRPGLPHGGFRAAARAFAAEYFALVPRAWRGRL